MATDAGTHSFRMGWMDALLSTPCDLEHGEIDPYARAVAFVLYRHMNAQGRARPGTRTLARQSGAAHAVVEDRLRRLEAAGWLSIERKNGSSNRYSALVPSGVAIVETAPSGGAVERTERPRRGAVADATAPPDGAPDRATAWRGPDLTAPSQPETAPPDGAKPLEPPTAASTQTTYARRPRRKWQPKAEPRHERGQRVTGKVLWPMMAWRKLELEREANRPNLPRPRSFREVRLLETLEEEFEDLHSEKAKRLRDKGGIPFDDLERFIYELDPTLSKHGWGPVLSAAQAKRERAEAEHQAHLDAMTGEDIARAEAEAAAAKAETLRVIASLKKPQPRPKRTNFDGPPSPYQVAPHLEDAG